MTALDWILGALFKPAATFARAQTEMRFGYWWILVSVFTLEVVSAVYSPRASGPEQLDSAFLGLYTLTFVMVLFDVHALLLLGVGRFFSWRVTWIDALKYTGLSWAVLLLEDVVTFYFALTGNDTVILLLSAPLVLWMVVSLATGIRTVTGLTWVRAVAVAVLSTLPWRAGILWLYWTTAQG